jgi:hypothetical protein
MPSLIIRPRCNRCHDKLEWKAQLEPEVVDTAVDKGGELYFYVEPCERCMEAHETRPPGRQEMDDEPL